MDGGPLCLVNRRANDNYFGYILGEPLREIDFSICEKYIYGWIIYVQVRGDFYGLFIK